MTWERNTPVPAQLCARYRSSEQSYLEESDSSSAPDICHRSPLENKIKTFPSLGAQAGRAQCELPDSSWHGGLPSTETAPQPLVSWSPRRERSLKRT